MGWIPLPRHCQLGAAGTLCGRDAAEDVRAGPAPVLHVALQPLRLLRGVRRDLGDHPGGAWHLVTPGHLGAALHPAPPHLQDHQVGEGSLGVLGLTVPGHHWPWPWGGLQHEQGWWLLGGGTRPGWGFLSPGHDLGVTRRTEQGLMEISWDPSLTLGSGVL